MEPRSISISTSTAAVLLCSLYLIVVGGRAQAQFVKCYSPQSCIPFDECPEFKLYVGKPARTWPKFIQDNVKQRLCDKNGKIYKFCCKPAMTPRPTSAPSSSFYSRPGGPKGRDLLEKECGKQSKSRISNGKAAEVFEFPWMALLQDFGGQFVCGGTLITKSHVLSAAHCSRMAISSVRVGENDLSKPIDCNEYDDETDCADPPQDIPVDKFIKHSNYSVSQKKNDIAVVRLKRPALLSDSVGTICLPLQPNWSRSLPHKMVVTGWGFTEQDKHSDVLLYANVPLVEAATCNRIFRTKSDTISVDQTQQCAGGDDDKQDNCKGDSGGPLQFFSNEARGFVQYGVVAFGLNSCGKEAVPSVYTKVSNYVDWILANLY